MEGERVHLFYLVEGGGLQPIQRFIMRWAGLRNSRPSPGKPM